MSKRLFVNGTVHAPDPRPGTDLLVQDGTIVEIGPGLTSAGAAVTDCSGLWITPLFAGPLAAGAPAAFAVTPPPAGGELERLVLWPSHATEMLAGPGPGPSSSPHLGMWVDSTGFIHQELTSDGRYDETRAGRRHAYQGAFRIDGDRIVYRDDLGFWAYGRFGGGVLHHGGYTFTRQA